MRPCSTADHGASGPEGHRVPDSRDWPEKDLWDGHLRDGHLRGRYVPAVGEGHGGGTLSGASAASAFRPGGRV